METKPLSKPFGKPLRKTKCNYSLQHFRNNFEWKLYKKIFQLSLGYPQLTFPMALLTFGLFISIVLASLEKLLHRPKTNFIILLDRFYSFWLSKGLQDRISQIFWNENTSNFITSHNLLLVPHVSVYRNRVSNVANASSRKKWFFNIIWISVPTNLR